MNANAGYTPGLESLKLGHGGDAYIASLLGIDPHTVARGRQELISGDLSTQKVRGQQEAGAFCKKKNARNHRRHRRHHGARDRW